MNFPAVCVVIVSYNSREHLPQCVAALQRQSFTDFEAIIVDNGSTDGTLEALDPLPPKFRLLPAGENLGFARANNLAARATAAPWLATLNADAYPEPDWLDRLMQATERHPRAVMFGSTQVDLACPGRLDGAGDVYHAAGLVWRGQEGRPATRLGAETEAFGPCAAAALYRREDFLAAGGFDERFFCYCEDIDLAFRLRLVGGHCIQVADAVVRHAGSVTAGRRSDFSVYHGTRNRFWTFVKNMPAPLFWPLLPAHIAATAVLLVRAAGSGTLTPTLRGLADGLRGLGPIWESRRWIQRRRRASVAQIVRVLSWSPIAPFRRSRAIRHSRASSRTIQTGS